MATTVVARVRPVIDCQAAKDGKTRQADAEACDINVIMRRYEKTGMLPTMAQVEGYFADVSDMGDYRTALSVVREADGMFMALPAEVRRRFDNDPAAFVDFMADPANRDEAVKLGLVAAAPVVVEGVTPVPGPTP